MAGRVPKLRSELGLDFVVANGENAAAGAGITGAIAGFSSSRASTRMTLGDHVWDQRGWEAEIAQFERVCRPANLPAACPGGTMSSSEAAVCALAVFTVLGRQYMGIKAECPFLCADRMLDRLRRQADAMFVEIHAEATSEKQALGWHLDGRVAAVLGTHTHVPTADAAVLPGGTAFLCDVGMTGPYAERPRPRGGPGGGEVSRRDAAALRGRDRRRAAFRRAGEIAPAEGAPRKMNS